MDSLFSHFSVDSDIKTNIFQFLNFGKIEISSKNSFITSNTGQLIYQVHRMVGK